MPLPRPQEGAYASSNDVLIASAARTATFNSDQFHTGGAITGIVIQINCTARSGTSPTLDIQLQDTVDGSNWNLVGTAFTQITATGIQVKRINLRDTPVSDTLRLACTIGGTTPSFTFSAQAFLVRD